MTELAQTTRIGTDVRAELDTAAVTRSEMGAMLEILMYQAGGPGLEAVRPLLIAAMPAAYWRLHGRPGPGPTK